MALPPGWASYSGGNRPTGGANLDNTSNYEEDLWGGFGDAFKKAGFQGDMYIPGDPTDRSSSNILNPEARNFAASQGWQQGLQQLGGGASNQGLFDSQGTQLAQNYFGNNDDAFTVAGILAAGVAGGAAGGYFGGAEGAAGTGAATGAAGGAGAVAPATNAALAESAVGTAGYGASSAGAGGGAGLGFTAPSWLSNAGKGAVKGGITSAAKGGNVWQGALQGAIGGGMSGGTGASTGGTDWGSVVAGGLGIYNGIQANKTNQEQIDSLSGLFGQNSPYAQALEKQLIAKDAASGRRSQYGPRAVELQARLAENASRLAPTLSGLYGQRTQNNVGMSRDLYALLDRSGMLKKIPGLMDYFKSNNPFGYEQNTSDYYGGAADPNLGGSGDPYNDYQEGP
jgi:hypothetical protein